jgi:hypothetical protein
MPTKKKPCPWCKDVIKRAEALGSVLAKCFDCKKVWAKRTPSYFSQEENDGHWRLTYCTDWEERRVDPPAPEKKPCASGKRHATLGK